MRKSKPFKFKPKHWYHWLNPYYMWRLRNLEKFMIWMWTHQDMDKKLEKAQMDMSLFGTGLTKLDDPK